MNSNQDLKAYAKHKGVFLWELAEYLSISEATITRRLRRELSDDSKSKMILYIDNIAAKKAKEKPSRSRTP